MATRSRIFDAVTNWTITLAGLANNAARQATLVNNSNNRPAAMIYLILSPNAAVATTDGSICEVYLLRADATSPNYTTDNAGSADAAFAPNKINATMIGSIVFGTVLGNATTNRYWGEFDTMTAGPLGPRWGIAVRNATGQSLHGTEGNHLKEFAYYTDVYL